MVCITIGIEYKYKCSQDLEISWSWLGTSLWFFLCNTLLRWVKQLALIKLSAWSSKTLWSSWFFVCESNNNVTCLLFHVYMLGDIQCILVFDNYQYDTCVLVYTYNLQVCIMYTYWLFNYPCVGDVHNPTCQQSIYNRITLR